MFTGVKLAHIKSSFHPWLDLGIGTPTQRSSSLICQLELCFRIQLASKTEQHPSLYSLLLDSGSNRCHIANPSPGPHQLLLLLPKPSDGIFNVFLSSRPGRDLTQSRPLGVPILLYVLSFSFQPCRLQSDDNPHRSFNPTLEQVQQNVPLTLPSYKYRTVSVTS
jgi:hypothetical protein